MRHAARRDANEPDIVSALEAVGASVTRLDGEGVPDLLVGWCSRTFLLEVKGPSGGLTAAQREWWATWKGGSGHVVRCADDALRAIGAVR